MGVTVVITGNKEGDVEMMAYQVSNQCMALVNDKIIVPTKDAPELAYILESSEAQYVPDVFFMEKDEYGNEIKKMGRPLPVEYLLIDVPVTTPLQPLQTFTTLPVGKILSLLKIDFLNPAYRTSTPLQDISVSSRTTSSQNLSQTFMFSCSWPPLTSCHSGNSWGRCTLPWQVRIGIRLLSGAVRSHGRICKQSSRPRFDHKFSKVNSDLVKIFHPAEI